MKDKKIIIALSIACAIFFFAALYFFNHKERIIVNLVPAGNSNQPYRPWPGEFK